MSSIFIKRPILAWVIAILTMLAGGLAIVGLPIAQYPDVAPPQVNIRASYPGANAETLQNSVTQVIEQTLTGVDHLLYFSSTSSSRGQAVITATFAKGVDPDTAQVQVQNQVQQALPRLPTQVQQQGLRVTKSNPDLLMIVTVYDETDRLTNQDVSDLLTSRVQDTVARVSGVGDIDVFGAPYAMRIWLIPEKLASYQLMPSDIINAIRKQNTEVAAGEIGGQPQPRTQMLNATVTAQSRLQTPAQFAAIIVKTQPSGATIRLADVARVELGAESYQTVSRLNGHPGAGMAISLAPGADALKTAEMVRAEVEKVAKTFPPGMQYAYANDATDFITLSVDEVVKTLIEAIVLVVIVMFVFLQSWRATLIPAIAVPVVLLGTFGIIYLAGFSINTMTLFALVLAIGLLVDDAIVVVENVERLMEENPSLTPRQATFQSMKEIQVALVAIAVVLSAVFLPMAFFGGSTGVIYRQFSLTIVASMTLSVLVALILSPALTATLLRQKHRGEARKGALARLHRIGDRFNAAIENGTQRYLSGARTVLKRKWASLAVFALISAALYGLFVMLPTGFLPNEDQGIARVRFELPPGATQGRTLEVENEIERYFAKYEKDNVDLMLLNAGGGGASGQNTGQGFLNLTDWAKRSGEENTADAITKRATEAFKSLRDAKAVAQVPPSIRGLGKSAGFTMLLQNATGMPQAEFAAARAKLLELASSDPMLNAVTVTELPDVDTFKVDVDQQKIAASGLDQDDVNATLATAWGGRYVNDFIDRGRVKRVYVQGDAPYRDEPTDIDQWFVRAQTGAMVPFSSFASTSWSVVPTSLSRFQGLPSFEFSGQAASGYSSGQAMDRMEQLAAQIPGTTVAWSGLSYQERLSSGQAPMLYALSLIVVFLCLAALYESWTIPLAVLLVVPLGLIGAVVAVSLRGLDNDIYLQIGLLTTMGLAAKNAILMIEFAEQAEKRGSSVMEAAFEAARVRLRPILMTSFAFIFGVLPLALSTGAGANSRIAIGTSVVGGMITATILAIFYIPFFFVLVRAAALKLGGREHPARPQEEMA
ncbi:efflux RND transporter permease subunit [Novosphingobium sp. 11B]